MGEGITGVVPYELDKRPRRLTERNKDGGAFVPGCFEEPCLGNGCIRKGNCTVFMQVCEKLTAYEDTGLTPDEVERLLQRVRDSNG